MLIYMNLRRIPLVWRQVGYLLAIVLLAPLVFSVIRSGYLYTFDSDELTNVQVVYHMAHGKLPYVSFFFTYSPVLHWFLAPIFHVFGFTIDALYAARLFMIAVFGLRIIAATAIVFVLFGQSLAVLYLLLFLLDPFTVFNGMQIRPDNLAVFFITLGILSLVVSHFKKFSLIFLAGVACGIALITSIKIVPGLGVLFFFLCWESFRRRETKTLQVFIAGICVPVALFVLYFARFHMVGEMLQSLLVYAKANVDAVVNPALLGIFYWPDNGYIYGFMGRPPSWFYAWLLPVFAFPSAYGAIRGYFSGGRKQEDFFGAVLGGALFVHFISLLFVHSVFTQYFLSLSWLYVLFFAVTMRDILMLSYEFPVAKKIIGMILAVALIILYGSSIAGNIDRINTFADRNQVAKITKRWQELPPETPIFTNYLFRPLAYPISYGYFVGDMPQTALLRMPKLSSVIEQERLPRLLIGDYAFQFLNAEDRTYISTHYRRVPADAELWNRIP